MTGHIFTLIVPNLDIENDAILDQIFELAIDAYPAVVNGVPQIEIHSDLSNAMRATGLAIDELRSLGLEVSSVSTDFVSVSDVAERADVSRETARLWSTGARRAGFPLSIGVVGASPIWDWADVYRWLCVNHLPVDESYSAPLPRDTREVMNARLAMGRLKRAAGWVTASQPVVKSSPQSSRELVGAGGYSGGYALHKEPA